MGEFLEGVEELFVLPELISSQVVEGGRGERAVYCGDQALRFTGTDARADGFFAIVLLLLLFGSAEEGPEGFVEVGDQVGGYFLEFDVEVFFGGIHGGGMLCEWEVEVWCIAGLSVFSEVNELIGE